MLRWGASAWVAIWALKPKLAAAFGHNLLAFWNRPPAAPPPVAGAYSWGSNFYGELGFGDFTTRSSPVQLGTGTDWAALFSSQGGASYARKTNGTLWVWGEGTAGQLGLGDALNRSSPVQLGTDTDWSKVSGGVAYTLALKTNGTLWAWGSNASGMLGLNDLVNRSSPVQVGTGAWSEIAAGDNESFAIKADGTLWAWGSNMVSQLGTGGGDTSSPVQVGMIFNWTSVAVGNHSALATRANGTLLAWGWNSTGSLGLGDTTSRAGTTWVASLTDWRTVYCGSYGFTLAIKTDGTLWAWGDNSRGQLGIGDASSRSSPVQVGSGGDWSTLSTNGRHVLALKTNGTLWSWGIGFTGVLGLGPLNDRSSPVQIGTAAGWSSVAAGLNHSRAIR